MEPKKIKLKSIDNQIFEVPVDICYKAKLISNIVDQASDDDSIIFLRQINGKFLKKILDYLEHYKDFDPKEIPKPFPEKTDDEFLRGILNDDWTFDYLQQFSLEEIIELTNEADYLEIQGLLDILGAKLANEMCNCEIEEARQKFGIECDMTEEEIAEIDQYPLD